MRNGTAAPGQSQSLSPIPSGFKISGGIGKALERPVIAAMGVLFCRVTEWGGDHRESTCQSHLESKSRSTASDRFGRLSLDVMRGEIMPPNIPAIIAMMIETQTGTVMVLYVPRPPRLLTT